MSKEEILGVDLGFMQTKAAGSNWKTKFRSIVKPRSEVALTGLADSEGFSVTYKGAPYNVGTKGSYDFSAERLTHDTDIAKLLTVFGQYQEDKSVAVIDLLVTGLPVYEYTSFKASLKESLTNSFQYEFNEKKRLISVQNTIVIPQSAGAYYDFILDEQGEPVDTALASENVLVLDVGGRTTDGCNMEASKYSQDSFTLFQGVWKAHSELRRLIIKDYRYNLKPFEVDVVMRTGILRLNNEDQNVKDLVYRAVASVYPEMRDELTLFIEDFRKYATVLLAGGGAHVFEEFLKEDISCPTIVIPNAEYANAEGYRKYGQLLQNNQ